MKKIFLVLSLMLVSGAALASDHESTAFFNSYAKQAFYFIAVALAAFGGTRGQSNIAAAAMNGIARNPSAKDAIQTPLILSLALIESLVIFTLISVFLAK